jgi:hypothetical protein
MGRKVPFRCSVKLHHWLLRPFSDCVSAMFSVVKEARSLYRNREAGVTTNPALLHVGTSR